MVTNADSKDILAEGKIFCIRWFKMFKKFSWKLKIISLFEKNSEFVPLKNDIIHDEFLINYHFRQSGGQHAGKIMVTN